MKIISVATCYSTLQKAKSDPSTRCSILIGSHKTLAQDDSAKQKQRQTVRGGFAFDLIDCGGFTATTSSKDFE